MKLPAYRRLYNARQLGGAVGVFALLMLLLESGGVYDWAQRMPVGTERDVMLPVATAVHNRLSPLRLERLRRGELYLLARAGWSDDPVALAEVEARLHSQPQTAAPVQQVEVIAPGSLAETAEVVLPKVVTPELATVPLLPPPPVLSTLPKLAPVESGHKRTIVLAGDSMMAVGLSASLLRSAPRYPELNVVKAFKSGSGLARPEVFDWQKEYPAMLGGARPDVVLVAIGANDGQGFVDNGVTYPFGSDGWRTIYQRRVEAYVKMLTASGATVVWLGLPPMKSSAYDERIALVNRIAYTVVRNTPGAVWYSTAGLVGDHDGRFQDFGRVHGQAVALRQPDGIHLSDEGAELIVDRVLPWLAASQQGASESAQNGQ